MPEIMANVQYEFQEVNLMLINANFSSESELKQTLDFVYARSKEGKSFHGLIEVIVNENLIITAIHGIKSNKGALTSGLDKKEISHYLRMPKEELIGLIRKSILNYKPKPVKRIYIPKSDGKLRPLGIPTILDRIIQECIRIILEPIVEAKYFPHSYGFRPLRAGKDAMAHICYTIRNGGKIKPIYAIEGDIKGFFDNVNHRTLINNLFNIGIHDKRILAIIKKMLKAGYFAEGKFHETAVGTPQGSILSPLLGNVYLNSFDWTVGRMYQEPKSDKTQSSFERTKRRIKGTIPKYLIRYADDWIILTRTQQEAKRLLAYLRGYFKYKLKLDLSEEKTVITNLAETPAKFLGYYLSVAKARPRPDNIKSNKLYPKIYPDREKVKEQVSEICSKIKNLKHCKDDGQRAVMIEEINAVIIGIMEHWKYGICSDTYRYIDSKVHRSAFLNFKKIYPKTYMSNLIPVNQLSNHPARHNKNKYLKTWAVKVNNLWIGITKASLTKYKRMWFPYNQSKTPFTEKGRTLIAKDKQKPLSLDRPALYDSMTLKQSLKKQGIYNFEYYMNREYAYNRDKGKCRVCGKNLKSGNRHCHHIDNGLSIDKINKVSNLAWMHDICHGAIHSNQYNVNNFTNKMISKINLFKSKLAK